jgi:hypothetical protein
VGSVSDRPDLDYLAANDCMIVNVDLEMDLEGRTYSLTEISPQLSIGSLESQKNPLDSQ